VPPYIIPVRATQATQLYLHGLPFSQASPEMEFLEVCAAEAIFYCSTMNSHRPRSQNTAKEQALIPEKDSRRT